MKKLIILLSLVLTLNCLHSQAPVRLQFEQGQVFDIDLKLKSTIAQQAMGQSIDFSIEANAAHQYKVTNSTADNTTLHHQVRQIRFSFDGMGQKMKFDSDKEKDMNGQFGKSMKELLNKKYDIIVDTSGKVLAAVPEKLNLSEGDSRMAIINSMLKDVVDLVQPPQKGQPSFFQILPSTEIKKGDGWTSNAATKSGKTEAAYTIAEMNDSTVVVDFIEKSVTITKANMMGNETTTTMNNKSTGKIIIDRLTGFMKEKTSTTESNGSTEASFGTLPVTSKTTTILKVNPGTKD